MATQFIDPTCRILRPLAEYAERLPSSRPGKTIHKTTLWRWATGGSSEVVLKTEFLGACRFTCDAYVADFMRRLGQQRKAPRTPRGTSMGEKNRRRIQAKFGIGAKNK